MPWIDLDLLGQLQYMVVIGKINVSAKVVYHHTGGKKMMGSSVDEEMTPVACAKVELLCANTCLYSKH